MSGPDPDEVITLAQAARIAGLNINTLQTQRRLGVLKADLLGRDRVLTRRALHEYLQRRQSATRGKKNPLPDDYQTPRGLEPTR